ncbi:hypothetical protein D3C80_22120 [compost metagenome]
MRCYHLQNTYLSGIHAGIQSAHCQHELALKYINSGPANPMKKAYIEWAKNHKTIIVLNGGMAGDLLRYQELLERSDNPYPWASFCESEYALGGIITNVGVVLPAKIYKLKEHVMKFLALEARDESTTLINFDEISWPASDGSDAKMYGSVSRNTEDKVMISLMSLESPEKGVQDIRYHYSDFEIELIKVLAGLRLM